MCPSAINTSFRDLEWSWNNRFGFMDFSMDRFAGVGIGELIDFCEVGRIRKLEE